MKTYISYAAALAVGFAAGVFASKGYFKQKYAQLAQDEIDSVIAAFDEKNASKQEEKASEAEEPVTKEEVKAYVDAVRSLKYAHMSDEEAEESVRKNRAPYVIAPDEFGNNPEYEMINLTLYADHIVADDDNNVMTSDEIEDAIGLDSLTHFGEYEEDSVHVRNDRRRCEYEILFDHRNFEDVMSAKIRHTQEE